MAKIKGQQIAFTAQDAAAILNLGGLTPAMLGQLVALAQDREYSLQEFDNSEDNGLVSIDEPEAGTVYRVLYPTTSVSIGQTSPGDTFWIEFQCGYVDPNRDLTFTFSAAEIVYWANAVQEDYENNITTGNYYQLQVRNVFGRVYVSMVNTELLAPTVSEEEEEEEQ